MNKVTNARALRRVTILAGIIAAIALIAVLLLIPTGPLEAISGGTILWTGQGNDNATSDTGWQFNLTAAKNVIGASIVVTTDEGDTYTVDGTEPSGEGGTWKFRV